MNKYIFFLGHQPHLSLAELEAVFGPDSIAEIKKNYAVLELGKEPNIDHLGGTTKISKLLKTEDLKEDLSSQILELLFTQISEQKTTRIKLGVSIYSSKNITQLNIKVIREILEKLRKSANKEFPALNLRTVEPRESTLNAAQIIHGDLLKKNGLSIDFLISEQEVIMAQTIQVPNLKRYTLRDYGKPKPSGKNGMLPPKLAQIMINLSGAKAGEILLDPFCGSGTVLQEAMLMGIDSIGTDLNPQIIEDARANLEWLDKRFRLRSSNVKFDVSVADATSHQWPKGITHLVCESYLGTAMTNQPTETKLQTIVAECNTVAEAFLKNIHPQLSDGATIVFALPCWFVGENIFKLPLVENLPALGYNQVKSNKVKQDGSESNISSLIYRRTGEEKSQIVGRDIYVLIKK